METLSLADHWATTGMAAATVVFVAMELLSLLLFTTVLIEYHRVALKHDVLPNAIRHGLEATPELGKSIMYWSYIFLTVLATVLTTALFLFQPHLL